MEKGFNDQELADIMNEIEALENDFEETEHMAGTPVMQELADMDEEISTTSYHETENIIPMKTITTAKTNSESSTSMSFHVEGNMKLSLAFTINGEEVKLNVTEDGLAIVMESGVSLNVPVKSVSSKKKVA